MPDNPQAANNGSPTAAAVATPTTDAQVDKAIQDVKQAASTGREITEFTLPDGQVFKGASTQELLQKIAASKSQANEHIKKIQDENATLRASLATLEAKLGKLGEALNPNAPDPAQQFDRIHYFQLLEQDPLKAHQYARAFDPDYKDLVTFKKQTQLQTVGSMFLSQHPDFPATPENVQLLLDEVQNFGGIEDGDVAKRLKAAYLSLQAEGKIKPIRKDATGPTPPPTIRGTSAPISEVDQDLAKRVANASTMEEARRIMREAGRVF